MAVATKKLYIIDTSVILKWLIHEEDSSVALSFLHRFLSEDIVLRLPFFCHWELDNFLGRNFSPAEALDRYQTFALLKIPCSDLSLEVTAHAFELMKKLPQVSFYDASYHALALHTGGIFLTADQKYYAKAQRWGHIELLGK